MSDALASLESSSVALPALAVAAALCAAVYLLFSAVVGARAVLGRIAADRVAEASGFEGSLRPGSRTRITFDALRQLSLAFAVAGATLLPVEFTAAGRALAAALGLVAAGRIVEIVLAPRDPELVLRLGAPFVTALDRLFGPLLAPLARGWSLLVERRRSAAGNAGSDGLEELREEHMEELIRDSELEGLLESEQGALMREIVDTGSMVVREVMTPRTDIDAIAADQGIRELTAEFVSSRHSRLPVYDGSLDRVVGVLALRDLLPHVLRDETDVRARDVMRPVTLVPGGKKVLELLRELQHSRQQLAVVVDEYGGTAGLVTLEDLIEEIVGEIHDEHETAAQEVQPDGRGGWLVSGMLPVDELEDLTNKDVVDDGVDTVGGLVFSKLGRVPRVGDSVLVSGSVRLTVVHVRGRRIVRVRVAREPVGEGHRAGDREQS